MARDDPSIRIKFWYVPAEALRVIRRTSRSASGSFALRLCILLLVPLLALGFLTHERIDDENRAADRARNLVDQARVEQAIATVYWPAQLEQLALEGLSRIDELGVDRDIVSSIAGIDFETMYSLNAIELDAVLDDLARRNGALRLDEDSTLGERLTMFRMELEELRALSETQAASPDDVDVVYARLDDILAAAIDPATIGTADDIPPMAGVEQRKLSLLAQVLIYAGDRGEALLTGVLERDEDQALRVATEVARFELAVDQVRAVLDQDEEERLDELIGRLEPLPDSLTEPAAADDDPFEVGYVRDSVAAVLDQVDFLEQLREFSDDIHEQVVGDLEGQAAAAEQAADRTRVAVLLITAASFTILLIVAWSVLQPLRRLTRRADLLGSGEFEASPLPVRGPSDVRTLTSTVNAMAETLAGVDREISRLADGGSVTSTARLPGAIGESIDRSFRRLESMTARLHASEMLASAIVAQAADAIWTIDDDGLILSANEASVHLIGVPTRAQIGTPLSRHVAGLGGETTVQQADGVAHVVVSSSRIDGDGPSVTAVMAHDISERRRFQERLAHQAHHDALTGLPNRLAVLHALQTAEPDHPLSVLFMDLDGFKAVNDMHGHLVGDRVLAEVGNRLQRTVRRDDVVARLGGDEFVIVMNGVSRDAEAVEFASRLITEIEQPYDDEASLFSLSASVGVATFPNGLEGDGCSPLDAIRQADSAVYSAKARGRARVEVFDSELQYRVVHEAEVEQALRSAIAHDELRIHLQPVLDLTTQTFTSAEALVRWERPGVGLVPPGDFIPIAEKSTLIEDIGRWVLGQTCATLAAWKAQDPTTTKRIAVNIAGSHLLDGDLLGDVDAALAQAGADPNLLEIELTESQLMDDYDRAADVLAALRRRGVRIAIDDFGTGYSSMAHLRELPIDTLKIDRSFVAPISGPASDTTVIDALVTIGHALGLSIVVEGIENAYQFEHLTRRGCNRAQGFLVARPVPPAHASSMLGFSPVDLLSPT